MSEGDAKLSAQKDKLLRDLAVALVHTERRLWQAVRNEPFRDGPHLTARNNQLIDEVDRVL